MLAGDDKRCITLCIFAFLNARLLRTFLAVGQEAGCRHVALLTAQHWNALQQRPGRRGVVEKSGSNAPRVRDHKMLWCAMRGRN
jgi:hypothetical protein